MSQQFVRPLNLSSWTAPWIFHRSRRFNHSSEIWKLFTWAVMETSNANLLVLTLLCIERVSNNAVQRIYQHLSSLLKWRWTPATIWSVPSVNSRHVPSRLDLLKWIQCMARFLSMWLATLASSSETSFIQLSFADVLWDFIRWDRAGVIVTNVIDILLNPHTLAQFVLRYSQLTDEECSHDHTTGYLLLLLVVCWPTFLPLSWVDLPRNPCSSCPWVNPSLQATDFPEHQVLTY